MDLRETIFAVMSGKTVGPVDLEKLYGEHLEPYWKGMDPSVKDVIVKELSGGTCRRCRIPWVKIGPDPSVAHRVSYTLYAPACVCYPVCPWCGRQMISEVDIGAVGCPYCGTVPCPNVVKTTVTEGRKAKVIKSICNRPLRPTLSGWHCQTCDKNYHSREDILRRPKLYDD